MKLNYTKVGDYLLPNLNIENKSTGRINKYGRLRLQYLKENNKGLYTTLLMKNQLTNHLFSVSNEAENKFNILIVYDILKLTPNYNWKLTPLTKI